MKSTAAIWVWGVFPSFSTTGFLMEVDCPSNPVSSKNARVVATAAAQTVHHKTGLDKPLWFIAKSFENSFGLYSNFEREYRACVRVSLIDRDVHLAGEVGICADQTLGNVPSGLKFAHTHTFTDSKIVSIPDMLIKPLKHLFAANCLKGLLPVLHTGQAGVKVCKSAENATHCTSSACVS